MDQISLFENDNLKADLLKFIEKEIPRRKEKIAMGKVMGSFESQAYHKGYLECLEFIKSFLKKY